MSKDKRIINRFNEREKYFNDNQLENEIWKPIDGYDELYKISNFGRVWSVVRRGGGGCFKKLILNSTGYYMVALDKKGASHHSIHRLLALAFIPNPENKPCVDHINRIRTDNRLENLRWVTYKENNLNKELTGSIHINTNKYKDKIYSYYRVTIGSVNLGNANTYAEAEKKLDDYKKSDDYKKKFDL
jgi:hypothetical protein